MKFDAEYTETDLITGEILTNRKTSYIHKKSNEPKFVKLFLDDIAKLSNLSKPARILIDSILVEMNYNNIVVLVLDTKQRISEINGMSIKHIDKTINELKNKDILLHRGRCSYVVNPILFGKGDFATINNIKMTIVYDENGRMIDIVKCKNEDNPIN